MKERELNIRNISVPAFRYLLMPLYWTVRFIFLFGSRKSAKSKHVAIRIIIRIMTDPEYNCLAMRKIAGEIPESVATELRWAINLLGVSHLFTFKGLKKGYVYTYNPTGQVILMKGISINPVSTKPSISGLTVAVGWLKDVWLEEAWEFTLDDFTMIKGTVRGGAITFLIVGNPYFQEMWCVKMAIDLLKPELEELKNYGEQWAHFPANPSKGKLESIVHWGNFLVNTKVTKEDYEDRIEELHRNPKDAVVTVYGYPGSPSGTILGHLVNLINERDLNYWNRNVGEVTGGLDYAVEKDAMTCGLNGLCPWGEMITNEGYYHSNNQQFANQFSDDGAFRKKTDLEMAEDIIEYFDDTWRHVWEHKTAGKLKVYCDSTAITFINVLNRWCEQSGITDIKFVPTKGKEAGKIPIEKRIIFEKNLLSRGMMSFLVLKDDQGQRISYPTRLMYEFENIAWKRTLSNGEIKIERDGSKVHPDMTNRWEYSWRVWMLKVSKHFDIIKVGKE